MLPNLTLMVAAYAIVRLAALALRQFPSVERSPIARYGIASAAVLAIALVTLCTLDTIGVGVSVGSALDVKRGRPLP